MSNIIGVRNNSTIVPYQSATKRTKEMDFTAAGLITGSGVNASAWVTARATAIAYRDSNSKWRLVFNIAGGPTSTGLRTVYTLTFASTAAVVFKNTAGFYQPVAAALPATNGGVTAYTGVNNGNVTIAHASTDQSLYSIAGDVELESEPTWAAANMEGVTAVDVYIPPASATESGIVTTGAQTIAGVKTFSSGLVCGTGNGTIANISSTTFGYTSGNFSLTGCTLAGTITFNVMRVGNIVTFSCGGTIALTAANYSLVFSPPAGYISGSNYAGSLEATGAGGCGDKARMIVGRATSSPSAKTIILDGVSDGTTSGSVGVYWTGTWQIL